MKRLRHVRFPLLCATLGACALTATAITVHRPAEVSDPCRIAADFAKRSCFHEALEELWLTRANCQNLPQPQRVQCMLDAHDHFTDALDECSQQKEARVDLCERLGGGAYHPVIDPEDFQSDIDNPLLPMVPGRTYVYEKLTSEGLERSEWIVTHELKEILGVSCRVVHDIESLNGVIKEDTFDWFAQDDLGNVWYFGELSFSYDEGTLSGVDGSWEAGENFAQPGIVMRAAPTVGAVYRQEYLLDEAEDAAAVLSLAASVTVPYGAFSGCLQTAEFTPLEPNVLEHKFYAAGVGLLLVVNVATGARSELISIQGP